MTILCGNLTEFTDTIAGLVRNGLTFEAYSDKLTIILLGGY